MAHPEPAPTLEEYQSAAALRAAVRGFLNRGETAARRAGLTPQRHGLLLMIKGAPDGSERASVGQLAERLRLAQNTLTELAARAEAAGLLRREPSERDGRVVYLRLTDEGERRLAATVAELRADRRNLVELITGRAGGEPLQQPGSDVSHAPHPGSPPAPG